MYVDFDVRYSKILSSLIFFKFKNLPWQVFRYNRQELPTRLIQFPVKTAQKLDRRRGVHGRGVRGTRLALGYTGAESDDEYTGCYEILGKLNQQGNHGMIEDQPLVAT